MSPPAAARSAMVPLTWPRILLPNCRSLAARTDPTAAQASRLRLRVSLHRCLSAAALPAAGSPESRIRCRLSLGPRQPALRPLRTRSCAVLGGRRRGPSVTVLPPSAPPLSGISGQWRRGERGDDGVARASDRAPERPEVLGSRLQLVCYCVVTASILRWLTMLHWCGRWPSALLPSRPRRILATPFSPLRQLGSGRLRERSEKSGLGKVEGAEG